MEDKKLIDEITESIEDSLSSTPIEISINENDVANFDDSDLESDEVLKAEVDNEFTPSIEEVSLPEDKTISKKIDAALEDK